LEVVLLQESLHQYVYLLVVNDFVPSVVLGEPFVEEPLLDLLNHRFVDVYHPSTIVALG
jgi:hypothetical protein